MKRIIILLAILLFLYPHGSYATPPLLEAAVDNTRWTVTFNSEFGGGNAYKNASILIIGPLDEPDDYEHLLSTVTEDKLYAEQIALDNTGKFNWKYNITSPDSFYVASVKCDGQEKPLVIDFMAYRQQTASGALAAINAAADANAVGNAFSQYEKILAKKNPLFKLVTDDAKKQAIYSQIIKNRPVGGYASFDKYTQAFLPILAAQAVGGLTTEKIKEIAERDLSLPDDVLYSRYASMEGSSKLGVFNRLEGEGVSFVDPDDFLLQYSRCVFLQLVEDEEYAQNLTSLVNKNANRFGINDTGYSAVASKINTDIMGQYYKDIGEFNTDLAKKIAAAGSDEATNGGQTGNTGKNDHTGGRGPVLSPAVFAPSEPVVEDKVVFTDLGGYEWAKPYIMNLYERGIVNGRSKELFSPDEHVLREEFTKMLVSVLNLFSNTAECTFSDTKTGDWHYPYIATAFKAGIIKGIDESSFGVGMNITREDIAVMIWRQMGDTGSERAQTNYTDAFNVSEYAREAVAQLTALGIFTGTPEGKFNPKQPATRAEAAKIIGMFNQLLKEREVTE